MKTDWNGRWTSTKRCRKPYYWGFVVNFSCSYPLLSSYVLPIRKTSFPVTQSFALCSRICLSLLFFSLYSCIQNTSVTRIFYCLFHVWACQQIKLTPGEKCFFLIYAFIVSKSEEQCASSYTILSRHSIISVTWLFYFYCGEGMIKCIK